LWQTTVSDALPQVGIEFNPPHSAFLSLALIAGLVIGAGFWGFGADLIGRRLVFNTTLLIAGVFGIAAGAANSFVSCAVLCSFIGFGVGGNRKPIQSITRFMKLIFSSACGRCHFPRVPALDPSVSSGNFERLVVNWSSYSSSDGLGKTFPPYKF
jgi:MFS family permease